MPRFQGDPVEQAKPRFGGEAVTVRSEPAKPSKVKTRTQELSEAGLIPDLYVIPAEAAEQGLRAARQGLTLGFSDELSGLGAGAKALFTGEDAGEAYTKARDLERARLRQFSEDEPVASTLGQLGGGLLTGTAPARAAVQAPSVARALGESAITGAGIGAVAGLGSGEGDASQQLASTVKGALIGGAAGPVVTGLARGVPAAYRYIRPGTVRETVNVRATPDADMVAGPQGASDVVPVEITARDRALDIVRDTMRRAGSTPDQIEAEIARGEALGMKPEVLADYLGDQGARRLYSTRTLGGEAASKAVDRLANRGEGTSARVAEDVQRATAQRGQSLTQLDARIENRRKLGGQLYRKAFEHGAVTDSDTLELLNNPRVASIIKKAADRRSVVADLQGEKYAPLYRQTENGPVLARTPTVEDLHLLKTSLDDDIRQAYQAGEGQLGGALRDFKNRIVNNLEREVPAYRKARELYKGDIEIEEAINNGRADILRKPVDQLRRDFAALSGAEQDAYRSGAIDAILSRKVDTKVDSADFARSLWGNADSRNRLKILVKNEDELARLAKQFDREQRMARTNRAVLGGSPTAMRQADIEDQVAGTLADVVTQGPQGAFVSTVQRWIRRAGGLTEPVADDVAKLLTSEGPETIRAVLKSLKAREQQQVMKALNQQRTGQAASTASSQQSTKK